MSHEISGKEPNTANERPAPMGSILVTGAAGFIGFHVARRLLSDNRHVVVLDNLNPYYDRRLKQARLAQLIGQRNLHFEQCELSDRAAIKSLFEAFRFKHVVHLAAQAGVRHSLADPHAYAESNLVGFLNILEACKHFQCKHFLYASSSSVYGANTRLPLRTTDNTDHPVSLYGATKKANEQMAHSYASVFDLPTTGLRFFTVYGPWGRPDMAIWLFTSAILEGRPIKLFNNGKLRRDFTYIDDVTEAVMRLLDRPPSPDRSWSGEAPNPATSSAPWRLFNVGNSEPVEVLDVVRIIEEELGRRAVLEFLPMQLGDVIETFADCRDLEHEVGFRPKTPLRSGIKQFIDWFREFHQAHDRSKPN